MSMEAEWRRQLVNCKSNRDARNDIAAIVSLMDFMATTKGELHMTESWAHAHAARLAKVADTLRRLIEEGIEARVSKWSREAECDRLKLRLSRFNTCAALRRYRVAMTDDIVARLREEGFVTHLAQLPRESKLLHEAADEIERLRKETAARCGDARPGAHTAGPSETFIPEAL